MSDNGNGEGEFTDLQMQQTMHDARSDGSSEDSSEHFDVVQAHTVTTVRENVTAMRFTKYLQQFDTDVKDEAVTFASLPVSGIDDGNRAEILAMGIEKEDEIMQHQNDLDHIDMLQRRRIHEIDLKREHEKHVQARQLHEIKLKSGVTSELVETYYNHTEQELDIHLTARQAEVIQSVGEIRKFDRGDYDPDKPDWTRYDQLLEFNIQSVRGLKNKVPRAEYFVMVSKWDKMGGVPMAWNTASWRSERPPVCYLHDKNTNRNIRRNCEICRGWAGGCPPAVHGGGLQDYELKFPDKANKIFTFFPAETRIKPYMALMFELIQLPRRRIGKPKVVGWGALPCVDSKYAAINGKFRIPLLRGAYQPQVGTFRDIQKKLYENVEGWLGNLYVDIFPQPRQYFGQQEFQMEQDFTNKLLSLSHYPAATEQGGWPVDGRKRGLSFDAQNLPTDQKATVQFGAVKFDYEEEREKFRYERPEVIEYEETPAKTFWGIIRKAVQAVAKENSLNKNVERDAAIKRAEEQKKFRFSIHPHGTTNLESTWRIQIEYCIRGIMDELSLREFPMSGKAWLNIFAMLIAVYVCSFIRSLVLYSSLFFIGVPVAVAVPDYAGITVEYSQANTTPLQELFFAFWGLLATFVVLSMLILTGGVIRAWTGKIPEHLSKFVFTIGIGILMVPWFNLIVDLSRGTQSGTILRLTSWFDYHQYGMFWGVLCFGLTYFLFTAATFVSVFLYTMRLHLNGILQDAYWRIMLVAEDTWVIPDDLELSYKELSYILEKSERWRGMDFERRKTKIEKLVTTDAQDDNYMSTDVFISIHTVPVGKAGSDEREEFLQTKKSRVHRSFYILNNGAIIESINRDVPSGMAFAMHALKGKKRLTVAQAEDDGLAAFGYAGNSVNQSVAFF